MKRWNFAVPTEVGQLISPQCKKVAAFYKKLILQQRWLQLVFVILSISSRYLPECIEEVYSLPSVGQVVCWFSKKVLRVNLHPATSEDFVPIVQGTIDLPERYVLPHIDHSALPSLNVDNLDSMSKTTDTSVQTFIVKLMRVWRNVEVMIGMSDLRQSFSR
ncbi:8008_t:CDS:2 [Paraglomus brasilianum]|uniref:8008_t:CDS:1 n=1 Tax=Paraglomus brasilianum TaxID=144538 RepID=A0A9N9GW86_9GLOM|nr:8008_t:CDS:2 [Paraglomus brasilianum]